MLLRLANDVETTWMDQQTRLRKLTVLFDFFRNNYDHSFPGYKRLLRLEQIIRASDDIQNLLTFLLPFERESEHLVTINDNTVRTGDGDASKSKIPITVICDNIRSAYNVGAIIRTCEFFNLTEIMFCGYTPSPDHPKVKKTAMGCAEEITWTQWKRTEDAIVDVCHRGITPVAIETIDEAPEVAAATFPTPCAIVIGNEAHGISQKILQKIPLKVQINGNGHKNSLNVSIALGICLHHAASQMAKINLR